MNRQTLIILAAAAAALYVIKRNNQPKPATARTQGTVYSLNNGGQIVVPNYLGGGLGAAFQSGFDIGSMKGMGF